MSRTARLWKGSGPLAAGGLLLSGVLAWGAEPPPLSKQLADLGRQALAGGETVQAQTYFRKALELDPTNAEASRGLSRALSSKVRRVAFQDPAVPAAPQPGFPADAPAAAQPGVPADAPAAAET